MIYSKIASTFGFCSRRGRCGHVPRAVSQPLVGELVQKAQDKMKLTGIHELYNAAIDTEQRALLRRIAEIAST